MKDGLKLVTLDVRSLPAQNHEMETSVTLECCKLRGLDDWRSFIYQHRSSNNVLTVCVKKNEPINS